MYTRQSKTVKKSSNAAYTPEVNRFASPQSFVQPKTEENPTSAEIAQIKTSDSNWPDVSMFTYRPAPAQPPRVQMKFNTQRAETLGLVSRKETKDKQIDPGQIASGKTSINPQDINLEQIGHGLIYQDTLGDSEKKWLQDYGYQPLWFPDGNVVNAEQGLNYGVLLPTPEGKELGREPILAFRGTSDLATAWQDLDINSPGHGGIQQILKGAPVGYFQGIVGQYGKLIVTGHSLGGALAQHFTGSHPSLVKRLVTFQSAAPNASQYQKNMAALDPKERPEVVHHIAKGDIVDLAGGDHLEGTFFEHDLEATGLASVSSLARIKQAHTSKLLNTEDVVGANTTLASGEKAEGRHSKSIREYQGKDPYAVKSGLTEAGRMVALNKGTVFAGGLLAAGVGLGLSIPEIAVRGTGKAISKGASYLTNKARSLFKGKKEDKK
ncbi:MAG TPA: hypothetical protein VK203_14675 [Nostocaceae cyanobacterium]|nr:hypothetical protein [Nostocaceae cyanobacterium]